LKSYSQSVSSQSTALIILAILLSSSMNWHCGNNQRVKSEKADITNHVSNMAGLAFMYRMRPDSLQGGNRSFVGFVLPENARSSDNASYEAQVISADTVKIVGISKRNAANTVSVCRDGNGNFFGWTYTGEFE